MSIVKIIPLGGVREEGKNLYVVEVNESIFVLDCGLAYPQDEMLGIDSVIPDFTYLEENSDRVVGIFLTHGHDDAVGGLPYLLETINAPVFGTELTMELMTLVAKRQGLDKHLDQFFTIDESTEIEFEDATVSFFKTTHTIPDSIGIVIGTDQGNIVYTGHFKFDPSVSEAYATDYRRLAEISEEGVLALLSDSNDAELPVENEPEKRIVEEMTDIFLDASGRVIVTCIGSNIARIQQVLDSAYASGRKVFFTGKGLYEIVDIAIKLDKISIPSKNVIGQIKNINQFDDDKVVILEAAGPGEPIRSVERMATKRHPQVQIKEGDLVYLATTPSVAMETTIAKIKDSIYRSKGRVKSITDNFKTSGHASQKDLLTMINILKPKYIIPIDGEMRMLKAHKKLARDLGYANTQVFLPDTGEVIEYRNHKMRVTGEVPSGDVLIDGIGVGDIGNVVLRDRRILSEDGIFIVVATISRRLKKVLVGPQITSRGFVYMKASIDLISTCSDMTLDVLEEHLESNNFDWGELKSDLREKIGKYLFKETKRRPVILPIIMEASSYRLPDENK